jgi:hypothetical protein
LDFLSFSNEKCGDVKLRSVVPLEKTRPQARRVEIGGKPADAYIPSQGAQDSGASLVG